MTQIYVLDPSETLALPESDQVVSIDISNFVYGELYLFPGRLLPSEGLLPRENLSDYYPGGLIPSDDLLPGGAGLQPDWITASFPDFPADDVDLENSYLQLTSHPEGDFDIGPSTSLYFSDCETTLTSGDCEARWSLTYLTTIDRSMVTGVRFVIEATDVCTFRCLSVRCVSNDWVYPPIDIDTLSDEARLPVTLDGSATPVSEFPTTAISGLSTEWPIVFRSDEPASSADPRPIDISIGAAFRTGSITGTNTVALYLREFPLDEQTQLDIDGQTMGALEASGTQPDYGIARYTGRTMEDLDVDLQGDLDDESQFDLERLPDYLSETWLEVKIVWGTSGVTLTIHDANDDGYSFDVNLNEQIPYLMIVDLKLNSIRVQIYQTDDAGNLMGTVGLPNRVLDTTTIIDSTFIKRLKGRFGWYAKFADGDAALTNIRTRGVNFGEVVTKGLQSNTPVDGAALVATTSSDRNLGIGLESSPWGGTVTLDTERAPSGQGWKVVLGESKPLQGAQTNYFVVEDFDQTEISFDIFFPSYAVGNGVGIDAFLYGELGRIIPLNLAAFIPDRWQTIKAYFKNGLIQSGTFRLMIVQQVPTPATWYVDNLSIKAPTVAWEGRGRKPDPWGMKDDMWTPFRDTVSKDGAGILFKERGTEMQIRGRALTHSAFISEVKAIPKYSELGRLRWPDSEVLVTTTPMASFTLDSTDRRVALDASESSCTGGNIIAYHWSFGDGRADYGEAVTHTYELSGTYTISLTVIDDQYHQNTVSHAVVL